MNFVQILVMTSTILISSSTFAEADLKSKLNPLIEEAKKIAADPVVVEAVKKENQKASFPDMTQDKWKTLSALDPMMKTLAKNPVSVAVKTKIGAKVSEAFVNAADGQKVALLNKTTWWNHKGKAKHDKPMAGEVWIGNVELDESTGIEQVQFAVPVMDSGKAIGSMVIGVSVSKLK